MPSKVTAKNLSAISFSFGIDDMVFYSEQGEQDSKGKLMNLHGISHS